MINLTAVDKFLKAVKTAKDYNSKEIRLSMTEAEQLALALGQWLLQERQLQERIMQLQDELLRSQSNTVASNAPVQLSGGSF